MPKTLDQPYAVIKTGGKQYVVSAGQELLVERLKEDAGASLKLDVLHGDAVTASVVGHERGPKIRVFKYKPKRGYKKTQGHRQELTRIRIDKVGS